MDTYLKTCISSASYLLPTASLVQPKKDKLENASRTVVLSCSRNPPTCAISQPKYMILPSGCGACCSTSFNSLCCSCSSSFSILPSNTKSCFALIPNGTSQSTSSHGSSYYSFSSSSIPSSNPATANSPSPTPTSYCSSVSSSATSSALRHAASSSLASPVVDVSCDSTASAVTINSARESMTKLTTSITTTTPASPTKTTPSPWAVSTPATSRCSSTHSLPSAVPSAETHECQSTSKKWIRPLGYAEKFMTTSHDFGCMTTVYALWLESRSPISFESIKKTASVMYRKMPNLRMVLGKRNGKFWWREMTKECLDIEAITTDNVIETFESLLRKRYRMEEGPLWFVRFVSHSEDQQMSRDTNYNLKYKYVCIFGIHHNISDGTTNMKFCSVFLSILNDILQGHGFDLHEVGTFAEPYHDRLADQCASRSWLVGQFLRRFYKGILSYGAYVHNFTQHFPMPAHCEAATRVLHGELDEVATGLLLKRCRMERVTLNSAFTAAANLAMYKMILEHNPSLVSTSFDSVQAINMRRYWPQEIRADTFGCHISMLDTHLPTHISDMDNFWEYSRRLHDTLTYELNSTKRALKIQPISERLCLIISSNSWLAKAGLPSTNDNHYCVTNMGDLSKTFSGNGMEVEVSRILRSVSCHFMPTLCQHTLQTFRGRFCYSLDYYSQKMTPEAAQTYADGILTILRKSIHTPN